MHKILGGQELTLVGSLFREILALIIRIVMSITYCQKNLLK